MILVDRSTNEVDELLHPPKALPHWEESYYFNWSDPEQRVFGFARISIDRARGTGDAVVLSFRDGRLQFSYPAVHRRFRLQDMDPRTGLRLAGLTFTMVEPWKRWRITLEGRDRLELEWVGYTPIADMAEMDVDVEGVDVELNHYEQCGRVTGTAHIGGVSYEIDGLGHRDHSWGQRDWSSIEGWEWIAGQADDFGFNLTRIFYAGRSFDFGFVHAGDAFAYLSEADLSYDWAGHERPAKAELRLSTAAGIECRIDLVPDARVGLIKKGLFLEEQPSAFSATIGGEEYAGRGVIEHSWHLGRRRALTRYPFFVRDLLRSGALRSLR